MAIETERKFLIERPDMGWLAAVPGVRVLEMVQTYLGEIEKTERRIRRIAENGAVSYIYTEKRPIPGTKISREEEERAVTAEEYIRLRQSAIDAGTATELEKTRYALPYSGHIVEIDVYPHHIGGEALDGFAVLEVELASPTEPFDLPEEITVVRELTGTRAFSNKTLAKKLG